MSWLGWLTLGGAELVVLGIVLFGYVLEGRSKDVDEWT